MSDYFDDDWFDSQTEMDVLPPHEIEVGVNPLEESDDDAARAFDEEIERRQRAKAKRSAPDEPLTIAPMKLNAMFATYPQLRPYVVDGLLRQGETANIIASPKIGKSFLAGNLACCIAKGGSWFGHDVRQGNVLILDNELHPETLAYRLDKIATEMELTEAERDRIEAIHLRGRVLDVNNFSMRLAIEPGKYSLIVLDALYRTIPVGTNENDNAAMMAIYNQLDHYAAKWGASIVVVHHSSKGNQSDKSVTDVGAGAGSISRAADTHIAIRPHEADGLAVMEAVTRSFKSPDPISIEFDYPLWKQAYVVPEVKKPGTKRQDNTAQEMEEVFARIPEPPKAIQRKDLAAQFGYGADKLNKLLGGLTNDKRVRRRTKKVGKREHVYYTRSGSDSGKTPEP